MAISKQRFESAKLELAIHEIDLGVCIHELDSRSGNSILLQLCPFDIIGPVCFTFLLALEKTCMHEVLNKVYLQFFSQTSAILRDESNDGN